MITKDFELHERNIRLLRNKRNAIIARSWIKYSSPGLVGDFEKIGYGNNGKRKWLLEKVVGEQ